MMAKKRKKQAIRLKVNFVRWEEIKREKLLVKSMYMLKCYSEHEQLKR